MHENDIYFLITRLPSCDYKATEIHGDLEYESPSLEELKEKIFEELTEEGITFVYPEKKEFDVMLQAVANNIRDSWERVEKLRDLEEYITTEDLVSAILPIAPGFGMGTMSQLLIDLGFRFASVPGPLPQLVWLMRRK